MHFPGLLQAVLDSVVPVKALHSQLRWQLNKQLKAAMEHGLRQVEVFVKGPGSGREAAIRALQAAGLEVTALKTLLRFLTNGCRPPKRRRV